MNDPQPEGSHGKLHRTTKILNDARRRCGRMAARGARTAGGHAATASPTSVKKTAPHAYCARPAAGRQCQLKIRSLDGLTRACANGLNTRALEIFLCLPSGR